MLCCGGGEEELDGPPANQYSTAPPRGGNQYGGAGNFFVCSIFPFFFLSPYMNFQILEMKVVYLITTEHLVVMEKNVILRFQ